MSYRFQTLTAGLLGAAVLYTAPALAQEMPEPAIAAQPIDVAQWQRHIAVDLPGHTRFEGFARMRFGFMVGKNGDVRSCMALPIDGSDGARGQPLCENLIEHAKFKPALDVNGNPMDSVFIIQFGNTPPVVAANYAGVPVI